MRFALWFYRGLANAYPHEFRMRYGADLDRLGEDAIPEIWRREGAAGVVRLLADIALQLPAQYALELRQDVAYAARMLAKSPGFTAVAVVSLAIGIGMCCAVRSEIASIVGPAPGLRNPETLAVFHWTLVSYPDFERYRAEHRTTAGATAVLGPEPFALTLDGRKLRAFGHIVSPEYLDVLGVSPASGRFFDASSERSGGPLEVFVSNRFWHRELGGAPDAVGRALKVNGHAATIVGIGPAEFLGVWPGNPSDIFLAAGATAGNAPELPAGALTRADRELFRVVFRLAPGSSFAAAQASLNAIARSCDRERGLDRERTLRLIPAGTVLYASPEQVRFTRTFDLVLWALVLALVCANLANLLLARTGERRREIAIRLSVGASRARLVRQLLTESVLLSLAGGAGGIALAYLMTRMLSALPVPAAVPIEIHCQPDASVLLWTLAVAMVAGIGFGLAPALVSARTRIGATLKAGAQARLPGHRRFGARNLFVVCQMGASVMLVLVTCFAAAGFLLATRIQPGFEVANLQLLSLNPARDGLSARASSAVLAALPARIARVEGARNAALGEAVPFAWLSTGQGSTRVTAGTGNASVYRTAVGANYFRTLGVALTGGREFERRDCEGSTGQIPAIVNQTAARLLFGDANPLGQEVRAGDVHYTVVGLARDVAAGYFQPKPVATLFIPLTAEDPSRGVTLFVRGPAGPKLSSALRSALAELSPALTASNERSIADDLARLGAFAAWQSAIFLVLGAFVLLLASIGVGGVTAYAVVRRRRELAIRMALGARPGAVWRLVVGEGVALVAVGSAVGYGGALVLERALATYSEMLARTIHQPVSSALLVGGAPALLAALALVACYLPARRAARLDPMPALRED